LLALDLCHLPFLGDSFDAVLCSHVLEHVEDDRRAMRELLRTLRPDGWAILQVPLATTLERTLEDSKVVDPQERRLRFGQSDHVRLYGQDYFDRLRGEGFIVKSVPFAAELGDRQARRYGLLAEEPVVVCTKA
jgi:SAM-dependent methyltransferase